MKLQKYMSQTSVCSRRHAEERIRQGSVFVNGETAHIWQDIDPAHDVVTYDKRLKEKTYRYFLYNKPPGIETVNPQPGTQAIADMINLPPGVVPIGRLDRDTMGLIILTDDTLLQKILLDPLHHVPKEYLISTQKDLSDDDLVALEQGVRIDGEATKPAIVKRLAPDHISLTITEGRNRQVRKMCRAVNNHVVKLKRVKIGKVTLGHLSMGEMKEVKRKDIVDSI